LLQTVGAMGKALSIWGLIFFLLPAVALRAQSAAPTVSPAAMPQTAPSSSADSNGGFAPPTLGQTANAAPASSAPVKVFKSSSRLVVLDVVVTDKKGAPVHGLQRGDFRVLEGGREQQLKVFEAHVSDGFSVAAPAPAAVATNADQTTNAGQEQAGAALNVILFDGLNTASSDQSFARSQMKKVIAELPAGSRIAIFVLRNDLHMVQGFTTDTAALAHALDKDKSSLSGPWFNDPDMVLLSQGTDPAAGMGGGLVGGAGSVAGLGSVLSGNATPGGSGLATYLGNVAQRDEEGLTSELRTRKTLAALSAMARYLSVLPGRKNLLWLSGTFPFDLLPDTSGANPDPFRGSSTYGGVMRDLALQMEAGHIAVYPVDVRGVADNGAFNAAGHSRPTLETFSAAAGAQLSQQEVMENIAHETGGRAIYNDNDVRGGIIESLNQGGNFYTLAYSPEDKNWNGKYRKIEVKATERGVNLYYRHGYLADDPATNKQVAPDSVPKFAVAMLRGAPERAEVVMTLAADATGKYVDEKDRKPPTLQDRNAIFQAHLTGTTEIYSISCKIDAKTIAFQKSPDGKYVPRIALTFLAYDADGKVLNAEAGLFNHPLSEAQYKAVLQRGLTVNQQMEVPLGRDYIRVGVHDLQNGKVGATELPVVAARKAQAATEGK
jgi:VWFA-related protein